jgi:hypothetical protein
VEDESGARLNVDFAGLTVQEFRASKKPVRPILASPRGFLNKGDWAARIAADYRAVGIGAIDLRISPLGGEDEGPVKVASALEIAQKFREAGIDVLFGFQPAIGHTAIALGVASGYSTGIGNREHFNYASAMSVQRRPPDAGKKRFGSPAGVFLPGAGITVPMRVAEALYSDKSMRTKLVCGIGICGTEINGPVKDPRAHYLHARADLTDQLNQRPVQWRAAHESDRIKRALELRQLMNKNCLPDLRKTQKVNDLGTRTLESLAAVVERHMDQAKSA